MGGGAGRTRGWGKASLGALVGLLVLAGCATTDEQRFPLSLLAGPQFAQQPELAPDALAAYLRMGAALERQGRDEEAAIAYTSANALARSLGRLQEALDSGPKAVTLAERSGKEWLLTRALERQAATHLAMGAVDKAIPVLERALALNQRAGYLGGAGTAHEMLSRAHRTLGHAAQDLEHAKRAVELRRNELAGRLPHMAYGGAWQVQRQESLKQVERGLAFAYVNLGWAYRNAKEPAAAREAFEEGVRQARQLDVQNTVAAGLRGLASLARDGKQPAEEVGYLQEAAQVARGASSTVWVHYDLGTAYQRQGRLPEAEAALRQAIAAYEELRRLFREPEARETYAETLNPTRFYAALVRVLADQKQPAAAFEVAERARARAFLDLLGTRVTLSRGKTAALVAEERELQGRINRLKAMPEDSPLLRQELRLAREAYQAFLQRVRQLDREQASLLAVEPLTLPEVQALLSPGTVLVAYFVTGTRLYAWRVDRQAVRLETLRLSSRALASRVQAFRAALQTPGPLADVQAQAHDLYRRLLGPVLRGRTPTALILVPHGILHYLPFHALMPAPDRYLLQDVLLTYASSASLLQFTREKRAQSASGVLAAGNPSLGDPRLELRYAEREVRAVAAVYPEATQLTAATATKAAVQAGSPQKQLLHFATHAELDEADPLGSALLFTPAGGDTGRLEVQEIFGLRLAADLVVLSACETALGTLTRGDELTGLTRAFIYAGTPSVITTLWQVHDRASYELMQAFYRTWQAGAGKAEALRQAQLATMQQYPHPYYWAAYQFVGEAR